MPKTPDITESEWKVMKLLRTKAPQPAYDLAATLEKTEKWHSITVRTLLSRLLDNKALRIKKYKAIGPLAPGRAAPAPARHAAKQLEFVQPYQPFGHTPRNGARLGRNHRSAGLRHGDVALADPLSDVESPVTATTEILPHGASPPTASNDPIPGVASNLRVPASTIWDSRRSWIPILVWIWLTGVLVLGARIVY